MKSTLSLLILLTLCGCGSKSIIVWNMKDVVGFGILLLVLLVVGILFLAAWIQDFFARRKKRNANRTTKI